MGQKQQHLVGQDLDYSSLLSKYQILEKLKTPKYEGTILQSLENESTYLLRETTKTDSQAFATQISIYNSRTKHQQSALLSIAGFKTKTTPQLCSTFYKIYLMVEFPKQSLCDLIIEHRTKHENIKEQLLWQIAENVIQSLDQLNSLGEQHQDIALSSIFIDQKKRIRVLDPALFSTLSSYSYAMAGIFEYAGIKNSIFLSPKLIEQLHQRATIPVHDILKSDIFSLGMCLLSLMNLGDMDVYDYEHGNIYWGRIEQRLNQAKEVYSIEIVQIAKEMIKKNEVERPGLMKSKIMIQEALRVRKLKGLDNNLSMQNKLEEIKEEFQKEIPDSFQESSVKENFQESPELQEKELNDQNLEQNQSNNEEILKYEEINQLLLKYGIPPISAHTITESQAPHQINQFSLNERTKDKIGENDKSSQNITRQLQFEGACHLKLDGSQHSFNTNSTGTTFDTLPDLLKQQIQKQMEEQIRIQVSQQMEAFKQEYKQQMDKFLAEKMLQEQKKSITYERIDVNNNNFKSSIQKENFSTNCLSFQGSNTKVFQTNNEFSKPEMYSQSQNQKKLPLQDLELNSLQTPSQNKQYQQQISYYQYVEEQYENGGKYEGQKLNGFRHGKGKFQYQDGGMYEGEWCENKMQGRGTLYYYSGKPAYVGDWVDDRFEGIGVLYNEEPAKLYQEFNFSDMEKIEEYWVKYEGGFSDDMKEGMGTLYLTNGEKFYGQFSNDCIMGSGIYFKQDGEQVKGIWENNQLVQII